LSLGKLVSIEILTKKPSASIGGGSSQIMNSCLVACTMVMLLSAHFRMSLYEQEYGYTYLRVFTHAFMLFIFAILVVTLIKVWKENFLLLKSYIVISIVAYLAINYFTILT
jgi:FlaA1/EpsC-like NDP-sugar epimerase